jgi:outer membrane protein TolC
MRKITLVSLMSALGAAIAVPGAAGVAAAQPGPEQPAPATAPTAPEPTPVDLMRIEASGLTADQVGARAAATSFQAKAQEENLKGAAARIDQAWSSFLPRLSAVARYTRLSDFTPPSFFASSPIPAVYTTAPGSPTGTPIPPGSPLLAVVTPAISLPLVLDNFLLQGTISVPISDYFLRINQNFTAATHQRDAIRLDAIAARTRSAADGKVAFYTWLRARGAAVVAQQALNDQKTHLTDAKNQFAVGNASRADVLRAETAVAAAELQVERSRNLSDLSEKQVRQAMHIGEQPIAPGESLDNAPPPPLSGNLASFTQEALGSRVEVKSIDFNAAAAREQAKVANAGKYPVVSAFGDTILGNPNARRFPQTNEWFPTWDVGVQATWSPNDFIVAGSVVIDAESRATSAEANKGIIRDGIEIEVMQAWQSIREQEVALESTKRQLASATEAYRVARELFNNGRATSTTLTDAETELTRARLDALNATVDARIARVRLEHALGRDTKLVSSP